MLKDWDGFWKRHDVFGHISIDQHVMAWFAFMFFVFFPGEFSITKDMKNWRRNLQKTLQQVTCIFQRRGINIDDKQYWEHENGDVLLCYSNDGHMITLHYVIWLRDEDMTLFFVCVHGMCPFGCLIASWHRTARRTVIIRPNGASRNHISSHLRTPVHRLSAAISCCKSVSEANATHLCIGLSGQAESRAPVALKTREQREKWESVCVYVCVLLFDLIGVGAVPTRLQRPCSRICWQSGQKQSSKQKQL